MAVCVPQTSPAALIQQSAPILISVSVWQSAISVKPTSRSSLSPTPTSPRHSPRTWVVKIVLSLQSFGFLLGRQNLVEAVLAQDNQLALPAVHFVLSQQLHDLLTHC